MSPMRLLPLVVIAVTLAGSGARCASVAPRDPSATLEFGGLSRTYLLAASEAIGRCFAAHGR